MSLERDFYKELILVIKDKLDNKYYIFEKDETEGYRTSKVDSDIGEILWESKFGVVNLDL